ncbi:MAG: hypothetical protein AB7T63_07875 [Planctomycetota bacterium]
MSGARAARFGALALALVLGAVVAYAAWGTRGGAGARLDLIRDWAPDEDVALWTAEWERRAPQHLELGDPPGDGPVHEARYWLSRGSHVLELKRRGDRLFLRTFGVDEQTLGGGWGALAEGRIHGGTDDAPFGGAVATFTWSCLGVRYRQASSGIGRLVFDATGELARATYMAFEDFDTWLEADAVVARGDPPPRGTLEGQVLMPADAPRFRPDVDYSVRVEVVERDGGPVAEALVQVMAHDASRVRTDESGRAEVTFPGRAWPVAVVITAGHPDYRNGDVVAFADDADVRWVARGRARGTLRIELDPRVPGDDPAYRFVPPHPDHDVDDVMACGTCHVPQYQEWLGSRHARMDDHGHVLHERSRHIEAGRDVEACDGCHRPGHALEPSPTPRGLLDANHCDLCHKIAAVADVREDGVLGAYVMGRPSPDAPSRPGTIHQVFGTRPDVTYLWMGAVWNPLFGASHLCAGCHQGAGGWREERLPKLATFDEWTRWALAVGPDRAQSCQDCHMRAGGSRDVDGNPVVQLAWDGLHRTPWQVHAHDFVGVSPGRLGEALDVETTSTHGADIVEVRVRVTNRGAGHKVPTGTWSKHLVLGVWARQGGRDLALVEGPRAWLDARAGEPAGREPGDWRRPAGFVFGISPRAGGVTPFRPLDLLGAWRASDVEDTRLEPGATRELVFRFAAAGDEPAEIDVRWQHRRGALGASSADAPWQVRPHDPPPALTLGRTVTRSTLRGP